MIPAEFHFLRPWWLAALPAVALLAWIAARRRLTRGGWAAICDPALRAHVLVAGRGTHPFADPVRIAALAATLAVLALAGPAWERLPQPVYRDPSALVIALDLSRSMDAGDLEPSRLARARFKVADVLERRRSGVTALVVYAGAAFTVTPLTDDTQTIAAQLPALGTELMPAPGSRADLALDQALELLRRGGVRRGDVLLITDEATEAERRELRRRLPQAPVRLFVLGVGTGEGAPIPSGRGFVRDAAGQVVLARLDPAPLRQLAADGGGQYRTLTPDDGDVNALLDAIEAGGEAGSAVPGELLAEQWRERGPWLLLAVLPLAAALFRRGVVAVLALALLLPPQAVRALEWEDLWLRPDQQASRALQAGEAERAARLAEDPGWRGSALYRSEDYGGAAEVFAERDDALGHYNRGNALARQGRYAEALEAYEQALALAPGDEDAIHNRDLVRDLLEQAPPQSGGEGEPKDDAQRQPGAPGEDGTPAPAAPEQAERGDDADPSPAGGEQPAEPPAQDPPAADARQSPRDPADAKAPPRTADETGDEPGGTPDRPPVPAAAAGEQPDPEQVQAAEQWLRRIPDDPGGLLRRKFLYQYRQRDAGAEAAQPW